MSHFVAMVGQAANSAFSCGPGDNAQQFVVVYQFEIIESTRLPRRPL